MDKPIIIAWWSAGITSAVAVKMALNMYDNVEIFYIETGAAHPDNHRFKKDCEKWYGKSIHTVQNSKGYEDQFDVIEKTGFVNGASGARCSLELKKKVRFELEDKHNVIGQTHGFDFSENEINRALRFKEQYPKPTPYFPLIDKELSKENCAAIIQQAKIELPVMYKLGYNNNNCIGCVKGGKGYWNKIRIDFPEYFDRMAKTERIVGHSCIKEEDKTTKKSKRVFLDELDPNDGYTPKPVIPSCGLFCQTEANEIIDPRVEKILTGELKFEEA